jgi:hypothetical protein
VPGGAGQSVPLLQRGEHQLCPSLQELLAQLPALQDVITLDVVVLVMQRLSSEQTLPAVQPRLPEHSPQVWNNASQIGSSGVLEQLESSMHPTQLPREQMPGPNSALQVVTLSGAFFVAQRPSPPQ